MDITVVIIPTCFSIPAADAVRWIFHGCFVVLHVLLTMAGRCTIDTLAEWFGECGGNDRMDYYAFGYVEDVVAELPKHGNNWLFRLRSVVLSMKLDWKEKNTRKINKRGLEFVTVETRRRNGDRVESVINNHDSYRKACRNTQTVQQQTLFSIVLSTIHQISSQDIFVPTQDRISFVFQTMIPMHMKQQRSFYRFESERFALGFPTSMKSCGPTHTLR